MNTEPKSITDSDWTELCRDIDKQLLANKRVRRSLPSWGRINLAALGEIRILDHSDHLANG
jgi:hypothetical protein